MPRFKIENEWYTADTYQQAREMHRLSKPVIQSIPAPSRNRQLRFQIDGTWYNAPTYSAARQQHLAAQVQVSPVAAVVAAAPPQVKFIAVLTPDADFVNRSTTRFGVGEKIELNFNTDPAGRTAASFGGLRWVVRSGPAVVVNNPANNGSARLTCGTKSGAVVLELQTATQQPETKLTKRIQVVRPNRIVFAREPNTGTYHRQGVPSAGFSAITYLEPRDVSFSFMEYREGGASYEGSGAYKIDESSLADLQTDYEVIHPVRGDWCLVDGGDNIATGSLVDGSDEIKSGPVPNLGQQGRFCWKIPQYGRVAGTRDEFLIETLDHVETVTANGQLTISKGGVVVTHNQNDPNSDI